MSETGYRRLPGQFWGPGIKEGDTIRLTVDGKAVTAVLMRPDRDPDMVNIRLEDGYILGLRKDRISDVQKLSDRAVERPVKRAVRPDAESPEVVLLSTGGTIAGRPDPVTGGLIAGRGAAELYDMVPELAGIARVKMVDVMGVLSENMGPAQWVDIARAAIKAMDGGVRGIVISHGTDTLHYTAAALSFMLQRPLVPIVLVGSQKSIDRPSSDAALNLIHALQVASKSDIAEVVVTMFGPTSDQYGIIHRGTRVRKMHTSARSTFRTINDIPLGTVDEKGISMLRRDYNRRGEGRGMELRLGVDEAAALLYFYPGMRAQLVEFYAESNYRGLVVAGTGMGHCNDAVIGALKRAVNKGMLVFMTSQTLWGAVNPYAYKTGRRLLDAGVVFLDNMLPETAITKLYWALSQSDDNQEVIDLMRTNIANEFVGREAPDSYLIYQGGIPEVADFLKKERL